jgi:hypothetical protein
MPANKISSLLTATSGLKSLSLQAQGLIELQQIYSENAPAELFEASRVGYLKAGTLFLLADNGAIAAKLRQLTPRLLVNFRKRRKEITGIRVEVQVESGREGKALKTKAQLSPAGVDALTSLVRALDDSPLKSAVRRLIRHRPGKL